MSDTNSEIRIKKVHFALIEAKDSKTAFSAFKNRLEDKNVFVTEYDSSSFINSKDRNGIDRHAISAEFIETNKFTADPIVWGGLYADAKENSLVKKFTEVNVIQNGTKKWETRYVLVGSDTKKRYDASCTSKGAAVVLAKETVVIAKENVAVQVEKVLTSHDPTVSTIQYIADETEHDNIYMFLCNLIEFDEQSVQDLYNENVDLDPDTNQWKIKVETSFEYEKRINV